MKKIRALMTAVLCTFACMALSAANLAGYHYEGICQIPGDLVDNWTTIELDGEDAEFSLGSQANFLTSYKVMGTGNNLSVTCTAPGGNKWNLKTTDGGNSLEGSLPFLGKTIRLWVVKVPSRLKPAKEDTETLKEIISSKEGYTSFIKVYQSNGNLACITSDFSFTPNGNFSITCDNEVAQNIFSNLSGTYIVDQDNILLTDNEANKWAGKIYNKGNYIVIPLGTRGSNRLEMILIR